MVQNRIDMIGRKPAEIRISGIAARFDHFAKPAAANLSLPITREWNIRKYEIIIAAAFIAAPAISTGPPGKGLGMTIARHGIGTAHATALPSANTGLPNSQQTNK